MGMVMYAIYLPDQSLVFVGVPYWIYQTQSRFYQGNAYPWQGNMGHLRYFEATQVRHIIAVYETNNEG